ncbi:MAG: D-alanyl-D-alanine carboxypeptidase [Actinomycetota bacterium]|nr:D-alanyl-D-alanine carboxypeptidase [Actinomycetota bacterium]
MRRRLALLVAAAALVLAAPAPAVTEPPPVQARAALVANGATGEVLYSRNASRRLPPASITKLMTALVAVDRAKPQATVAVSPVATSVGESSVDLRAGERLPLRDLLAAALVQSANDAAYAIAAHVGRGNVRAFVRLMNARARLLGLAETRFVRPDGLDTPGHYSSARDVLALARAAMQKPLLRRLVRLRSARIAGGRVLFSWNDLLASFPGLVGVKTGHTSGAGWCQVALARRDGVPIYAVILGSPSRTQRNRDLRELLEWGLAQYARVAVVEPGRTYARATVPFSEDRLRLLAAARARAVVSVDRPLVERVRAPSVVELPLESRERVGEIEVREGRRIVARVPLVAARAVSEPGLRDRVRWYAARTLDEAGAVLEDVFGAVL